MRVPPLDVFSLPRKRRRLPWAVSHRTGPSGYDRRFAAMQPDPMQSLWMIAASLLFACMGVCVKLGSALFSAGEMVFARGLVGVLMMVLLARLQGVRLATPLWRLQLAR